MTTSSQEKSIKQHNPKISIIILGLKSERTFTSPLGPTLINKYQFILIKFTEVGVLKSFELKS
jgi:hypothetical protein